MCRKLFLLTSFVVVLGLAGSASAQLIAYEPFDYPANGLSGNDGGSGWDGAWDGGQQVTAPGLDFSPLSVEGNKATVVGDDSFRNLPEPMGDDEIQLWISFIGQADQQPGADMWGGVSFHEPGETLFLGIPWQPGPDDKVWGLDTKGDGNRLTEIPITEKILFVARIDFNTEGDNETVTAWAKSINDPDPWDLTDETAFAQYTSPINIEFSRVRVAGAQPVNIDEIRLSMTPPIEPVDMKIGFAVQTPVIDGEADGIWAVASTQNMVPHGDPANASGSWKALYDLENLYVIVDVTDDILQNDSAASWQDDSVEFYFDGGNTKLDTPLSGDDHQYTFAWTTDEIQGTNIDGYTEGIEHAQVDTDTGWRIEIKLPWLSMQGAAPQAGDLIGIDCFYNDDDDGGDTNEDQIWTFATQGAWNDASQWGTAGLATIPTPVDPGTDGLVAFYALDGDTNDSSGNELHGTIVGDPGFVEGQVGMALDLDGTDDVVELGKFDVVGGITLAAWIKPDDFEINDARIITKANEWSGDSHWWMVSTISETSLRFRLKTDEGPTTATLISDPALEAGVFTHVAATWDGSMMRIYKDGIEIASQEKGGTAVAVDPNISVAIGSQPSDAFASDPGHVAKFFDGLIDEVQIYERALSDGEILYLAGFRAPASDVTAPGDIVQGVPNDGLMDGDDFGWPGAETPDLAIDDDISTKFLHFKGDIEPTGIQVEPASGPSVVTGLTLTTANDSPARDPATFELSGSNDSIDGPYILIASGDVVDFTQEAEWPRFTMNATPITFDNDVAYKYYQVIFPTVRDAAGDNSMQIAEIELLAD